MYVHRISSKHTRTHTPAPAAMIETGRGIGYCHCGLLGSRNIAAGSLGITIGQPRGEGGGIDSQPRCCLNVVDTGRK